MYELVNFQTNSEIRKKNSSIKQFNWHKNNRPNTTESTNQPTRTTTNNHKNQPHREKKQTRNTEKQETRNTNQQQQEPPVLIDLIECAVVPNNTEVTEVTYYIDQT